MRKTLASLVLGIGFSSFIWAEDTAQKVLPAIVRDESAGDWVVDRFAGNSTAGDALLQGPAAEAGGMGRGFSLAVAPDGRTFFPVEAGIAEVAANGVLRVIVSKQEWSADGQDNTVKRGGLVAWNPVEKVLYFWGKSCIRKLVEKPDGSRSIEIVVGNPKHPGVTDGPIAQASLKNIGNIMINSRGTVFFYDGIKQYGQCLRKLENGVVTTLNDKMRSGYKDGPLKDAMFNFIDLGGLNSIGENDDILYIADHWNGVARRIDLKTEQVTTVAGWLQSKKYPYKHSMSNDADGPALDGAITNSGLIFTIYDPIHKAVWLGGPDETRSRWLKDGKVTTVVGSKASVAVGNVLGTPGDSAKMTWTWVLAVDAQGRVYVNDGADHTGYWRMYNKKEVSK